MLGESNLVTTSVHTMDIQIKLDNRRVSCRLCHTGGESILPTSWSSHLKSVMHTQRTKDSFETFSDNVSVASSTGTPRATTNMSRVSKAGVMSVTDEVDGDNVDLASKVDKLIQQNIKQDLLFAELTAKLDALTFVVKKLNDDKAQSPMV